MASPDAEEVRTDGNESLNRMVSRVGVESKEGRKDERGFAVGAEYELRFHKNWGVGGLVEFLGHRRMRPPRR